MRGVAEREVDSLIKYGLIGMGFSCYCAYLQYKYQVHDYGEWNHTGDARL